MKWGEITVFLSMCLMCVFALICVMIEGARTAGSRFYFQVAVNGSLDTLFSQYHRELWKQYRILGLYYESEMDLTERLETYVEKYLSVENWYPIQLGSVDIEDCITLTDQGGDFLTQEILDYMRYGIWDSLDLKPEEGEQFFKDVREAAKAGVLTGRYSGHEKEVQSLEKAVEDILNCVKNQESCEEHIRQALEDDDIRGFFREAKGFRKEAKRMDSLLTKYENRAAKLKNALSDSKSYLSQIQENFQEDRRQLLEEQMNPYMTYVEEDGRRYQELLCQKTYSLQNLELLERTEEMAKELEESRDEEEEDREEFSLEPAVQIWEEFCHTKLDLTYGKGDKEKQGFLEQVRNLAEGNLLAFVLPEGMEVSKASLPARLPSSLPMEDSKQTRSFVDQILINQYCGEFFLHALSQEKREVQYEIEYLLQGHSTDKRNLEETIGEIFLIRQGLYLIHILSDTGKREEAKALAAVITGAVGLAPLLEVMACFIMVVWAMGEAVMDIRSLLSGGKVPLWKNTEDWKLGLEGLLSMGKEKRCPDSGQEGKGFSYETYLKLLLLVLPSAQKQKRKLDVIQMNLQRKEPEFSLDSCAYQVDIHGKACGRHVFFALPLVENFVNGEQGYPLEALSQKAY